MKKVLSDRIRQLCEGKTIAECARLWGIQQASLDRYVKGQRTPNGDAIEQICRATGVSADWLLGIGDAAAPPLVAPPRAAEAPPPAASPSAWLAIIASQQETIALLVRRLAPAAGPTHAPAPDGGQAAIKTA